jgi:hypothetical protein
MHTGEFIRKKPVPERRAVIVLPVQLAGLKERVSEDEGIASLLASISCDAFLWCVELDQRMDVKIALALGDLRQRD